MKHRKETNDTKEMSFFHLAKLLCLMTDIEDDLQSARRRVVVSWPPRNLSSFKILVDDYEANDRDWREPILVILKGKRILDYEEYLLRDGENIISGCDIELTSLNKKKFDDLYKEVASLYELRSTHPGLAIAGGSTDGKFVMPELSEKEQRQRKHYPRKDVIDFTGNEVGQRSYEMSVNGHPFSLEYVPFGLLLYLAIALKKRPNGWVTVNDVCKEKIVLDKKDVSRVVSKLRRALGPFIEHNNIKIIQCLLRKKKYRLTTLPSRIVTPAPRWLSSKYKEIKAAIVKEKKDRLGAENV